MTAKQTVIDNLRAKLALYQARFDAAMAGELFGGPGDYEAFMGQWREVARRLQAAEEA